MTESIAGLAPATTGQEVVFTRYFSAERALVFDMWTKRKHLERWWGPEGFTLTSCDVDPRPGGTLRLVMRGLDGSEHAFHGTYFALVPGEWIVFTANLEDAPGEVVLTSVSFEELGAMTRMEVRQTVPRASSLAQGQVPGWLSSLTRLSEYLASL